MNQIKIAIIGAGKIANSLVPSLQKAKYEISFVVSKNLASAKSLSSKFNIKDFSNSLKDIPQKCNLFILSVPDSEISITAKELSKQNLNFKKSLFIHLSGAESILALRSLEAKHARVASFHIMQTFPSKRIVKIRNSYAAVETNEKSAHGLLFELAENLQLKPFEISPDKKALYHLAGVFASNFLVGNLSTSELLFNKSKKDDLPYFDVLGPIINSTLTNIKNKSADNSLSGPIQRGDIKTIRNHISSLKKLKSEPLVLSYISQSLNLLSLIKEEDLKKNHEMIKKLLIDELKRLKI